MSIRRPLVRLVSGVVALGAGALAVAGGLELHGSGLVAVSMAGALAGCLALGVARETPGIDRRSSVEVAVQTAAWTIGALLVLSGAALIFGGVAAALTGVGLVAALTVYGLVRVARSNRAAAPASPRPAQPTGAPIVALESVSGPARTLSTRELGREWVRTGRVLGGALLPADRAEVARRREEVLDELELRDPAGFARWLAADPHAAGDPAEHVHGERTAGTDVA